MTQHLHQASYQHSIVSGFYPVHVDAAIDEVTVTYRADRPDLGAHYGRTRGTCRCGVEVMQLCVEGDTGFSNRRGWVPVADLEAAYAENHRRSEEAAQQASLEALDEALTAVQWHYGLTMRHAVVDGFRLVQSTLDGRDELTGEFDASVNVAPVDAPEQLEWFLTLDKALAYVAGEG